jgi:hypothetical protein
VAAALVNFADFIRAETLATRLTPGALAGEGFRQQVAVGDAQVGLALRKL